MTSDYQKWLKSRSRLAKAEVKTVKAVKVSKRKNFLPKSKASVNKAFAKESQARQREHKAFERLARKFHR